MKIFDWRKRSQETQETIRIQAVKLIVEAGEETKDVIRILGITSSRLYDWLAKYREGGIETLKSKPRGGSERLLEEDQEMWIGYVVRNCAPDVFGFNTHYWTRQVIVELIKQEYDVDVSVSTAGNLLHRLRLSCQKPTKRAYQQNRRKVARWLKETFPAILEKTRRCGGVIYFLDESGIRSTSQVGRTWGVIGQTPEVEGTCERFGVNLISAIDVNGDIHYGIETGTITGGVVVEFLKILVRAEERPISLLLDGHPAHRAKVVTEYVKSTQGKIHLYFFPGYSPKLNPVEYLWNYFKGKVKKQMPIDLEDLIDRVLTEFNLLQKLPEFIRRFFDEPNVRYAK